MQCVNCHFENLAGLEACSRCGTSLRLGAASIDVHPIRARDRRIRRTFGDLFWPKIRRLALFQFLAQRAVELEAPPVEIVPRMIVSGWPQIYLHREVRGWTLLGVFLALGLWGILFSGTF
jgi:hypothetical protein